MTLVPSTVRLAEVLAAISVASDIGHDQPLEKSLRNAVIAARLADELGLARQERSDAYYVALLRSMGCTANAHDTTALIGVDDRVVAGLIQILDAGDPVAWAKGLSATAKELAPELRRTTTWFLENGRRIGAEAGRAACEVSTTLARRLGLSPGVQAGLDQIYERFDGRGSPGRAHGEELTIAARVAHLVDVAEIAHRTSGVEAARALVRARSGGHFDPDLAAAFERAADELLDGLDGADMLQTALHAEPGPQVRRPYEDVAALAVAIADFADLKSPWTLGHSPAVAELAAAAGPEESRKSLRLAGLLHDLGRVAVPNSVWERDGPLGSAQWERVRLHSYFTDRILSRTPVFAGVAALAAAHHERLDGSGYHRAVGAESITPEMRVLAAADAFVAMVSARPQRPAMTGEAAAAELRAEVAAGRLCRDATEAVLGAAGQETAPPARPPNELTEREVEVLGLLARGLTNKEIAAELYLSPRTVQHHVAHIFDKVGRRTRAGAAMFAMEHHLVGMRPRAAAV